MRRLLLIVVMLLSGGNAGLAQVSTLGTTAMGLPSTPGTMLSSPLNGPSPFSAVTQPGTPDTTLAPVPLASDPTPPWNGGPLLNAFRADCAGNSDRDVYFHGRDGRNDAIDISNSARSYFRARRCQYHRDNIAGVCARQFLEHRMQFDAGRPADQRRGVAAFDAADCRQSAARRDSVGRTRPWQHQSRSDGHRDANTEYVGLRREHHNGSGDARHDDAGKCHRRARDARRVGPPISRGLLMPRGRRPCWSSRHSSRPSRCLVGTAPQAKAKVEGGFEAYAERLRQEKIQLYEDRLAKGGFLPYVAGGGAVAPTSRRRSRPGAIWSARATGAAPISSLSSPSSSHRPR
jgi:hypothetical protein